MSTNAEWATKASAVLVMIAGQRGTIQYGQLGKRATNRSIGEHKALWYAGLAH